MTTLQLVVTESVILPTKHQRNRPVYRILSGCNSGFWWRDHRPGHLAPARTGAHYQGAVRKRIFQRRHHLCAVENIRGTGGAGIGSFIGERIRVHQPQIAKPHVFHGAGHRTNIAGV